MNVQQKYKSTKASYIGIVYVKVNVSYVKWVTYEQCQSEMIIINRSNAANRKLRKYEYEKRLMNNSTNSNSNVCNSVASLHQIAGRLQHLSRCACDDLTVTLNSTQPEITDAGV